MAGPDVEKDALGAPCQLPERIISNTTVPVAPADADVEFNPPDGGVRAWSQVLAALLINAMTWGYPASFGVYQLHYEEVTGLPSAQISWIGSIQIFLTFGICAVGGRLSDAGFARQTVAAGCFLSVLGTFMTSLCVEYWQMVLAQGVCTGLGLGLAFMPAVSVASSYFKRKRAFALAVAAVGTSVGSLIFPSTVQYLIPQIGFRWAVRCAGFVALVITLLANSLLKPYVAPRKTGALVEWTAFRELPYVFFALGAFLNLYALYFGFFYINAYARNIIGFSSIESVGLLLITNAMGIPIRPVVGYIADHYIGPINAYIITSGLLSATVFGWIGVKDRTGMYVFSVFFGLANGGSQGMFVGSLASLTKDPQKMGTRFGMVCTICAFATLAGPPTAGAIIDSSSGDFIWAQVWGGAVIAGAVMALASCRVAATGWRWKAKI
ncbi:Aspyridones efflux protein apdF [Paramyrothecium foliicola]|nr:Aspyridones efflux protein apdF [Paramyrothecium foliicola]